MGTEPTEPFTHHQRGTRPRTFAFDFSSFFGNVTFSLLSTVPLSHPLCGDLHHTCRVDLAIGGNFLPFLTDTLSLWAFFHHRDGPPTFQRPQQQPLLCGPLLPSPPQLPLPGIALLRAKPAALSGGFSGSSLARLCNTFTHKH